MPVKIDEIGNRYGSLVVIAEAGKRRSFTYWTCRCDCGATVDVNGNRLRRGRKSSCGCAMSQVREKNNNFRHGMVGTPTYKTWTRMIQRCELPSHHSYRWYGGRGIKICQRWRSSFVDFLADMGERQPGMTIDRIDVDGDYEPGNCRWADKYQQANNRSLR